MKVTKLVSQKRDPSRVNVYIDGEFSFGISLDSLAKYNIYVGMELEDDFLSKVFLHELKKRFLQRSSEYISRSPRTELQISRYIKNIIMKKKGVWYSELSKEEEEKILEHVISKLKKYGYIDDSHFAEQFIQSRLKSRPRGSGVIMSELISKGVSRDIAEDKVKELVQDEYALLCRVYEKKYKDQKITSMDNKKISYLFRKGFSWDLIEKLINNESEE